MKIFIKKAIGVVIGVFLTTCVTVHADQVLYSNTNSDALAFLGFTGTGQTIGNEITLGAVPSATLSSYSFEVYSPDSAFANTTITLEAFLYKNDGSLFPGPGGYPTPSTSLYDSGTFTISAPLDTAHGGNGQQVETIDVTGLNVAVPNDFTFALEYVSGLSEGETFGLELFNNFTGPGQNYNDYWYNNGSGWGLYTNGVNNEIGAQFIGTATPEPSAIYLGSAGATLLIGLTWLRRRQESVKQD